MQGRFAHGTHGNKLHVYDQLENPTTSHMQGHSFLSTPQTMVPFTSREERSAAVSRRKVIQIDNLAKDRD